MAARSTPSLTDHPSRETTATPALLLRQLEHHTTSPSPCHRLLKAQARAPTYPRKTTPTPPPTNPKWSSSKQRTRTCANACERSSEPYVLADVTAAPARLTAARQTRLSGPRGIETMVQLAQTLPARTPLLLQASQRGRLATAVCVALRARERGARVRVPLLAVAEAWVVAEWRLETTR